MPVYPIDKKKPAAYKDFYEDRHREPRPDTMVGVTIIKKSCAHCKTHRSTAGGKILDLGFKSKWFICAPCVSEGVADRLNEKYCASKV